jgi:hypothetical protein
MTTACPESNGCTSSSCLAQGAGALKSLMMRAVPETRIELPIAGRISARRRERDPMSSPWMMSIAPPCGQLISRRYPARAAAAAPVAGSSYTPPDANAFRA